MWESKGSEGQLETLVRGYESESFIEPVRIWSRLVGGQLHQHAEAATRLADRPGEHRGSQSAAAMSTTDPYRLDLSPKGTATGEPGDEAQLHGRHHSALVCGHKQQMSGVRIDDLESVEIWPQVGVTHDAVATRTELIVDEQHDLRLAGLSPDADRRAGSQGALTCYGILTAAASAVGTTPANLT